MDYIASRAIQGPTSGKNAVRNIVAAVGGLKASLEGQDGQLATLLGEFEQLTQKSNVVFGEIVGARRHLGHDLEDGLIAKFLTARGALRRQINGMRDVEVANLADDIMERAIHVRSGHGGSALHAFNGRVTKIEELLASNLRDAPYYLPVKTMLREFVSVFNDLISTEVAISDLAIELGTLMDDMRSKRDELDLAIGQVEQEARGALEQSMQTANVWLWIDVLFAGLVCATVPLWIKKSVSQPLQEMAVAMQRLSNGELDVTISRYRRRDELGKLSRAFFRFQRRMRVLVELSRDLEVKQQELIKRQSVLELILSSSLLVLPSSTRTTSSFSATNATRRCYSVRPHMSSLGPLFNNCGIN